MKARTLTSLLGVIFTAALVLAPPTLAYYPHSEGEYFDYGYENDWDIDQDYFYDNYGDYGYSRPPYYDSYRSYDYDDYYGYEHPSGLFGYWGKDTEHHRRGHRHHHLF